MERGEVWLVRFPGPSGVRPAVLLTRNGGLHNRSVVTVAPVTSTVWNKPFEVALGPADGLRRACAANLDSLTTLDKSRLIKPLCRLSLLKMEEVKAAALYALELG